MKVKFYTTPGTKDLLNTSKTSALPTFHTCVALLTHCEAFNSKRTVFKTAAFYGLASACQCSEIFKNGLKIIKCTQMQLKVNLHKARNEFDQQILPLLLKTMYNRQRLKQAEILFEISMSKQLHLHCFFHVTTSDDN